MQEKRTVVIGTIGAGYAAGLHAGGYQRVCGLTVRLKTICDVRLEAAEKIRAEYGYEQAVTDYEEMLSDPEIDVIDIVTPPFLHCTLAIKALQAGKHVICEKPLTGYFGRRGELDVGAIPKSLMYREVMEAMDELKTVAESSGQKFMYAENFVYAPPVQRAAQMIRAKKSKILYMRGEMSLNGSSSPLAGKWSGTGGGILMRNGCHPIGGMLWLKQQEAAARGETVHVTGVVADCGVTTRCLTQEEMRHLLVRPEDVEDYSNVTITFSDGTKALAIASDTVLGGSQNYIKVYSNDSALVCNITPTNMLESYFMDQDGLDDIEISQFMKHKTGWNQAWVNDEFIRGYTGELQNFMDAVAYDLVPDSGFSLAYDTVRIVYAAYQSAEEGRRISF